MHVSRIALASSLLLLCAACLHPLDGSNGDDAAGDEGEGEEGEGEDEEDEGEAGAGEEGEGEEGEGEDEGEGSIDVEDGADGAGSGGSGGPIGDSLGPCEGCRVYVPANVASPAPLLVALHGDEGRDFGVDAATAGVISMWRAAADAHGVIILALACPASEGCNGAWSDHLDANGYQLPQSTLDWLDAQVDAVEDAYDVDITRETLTGWSGGAYWLGYAAQARADRFASVAFVAGGMPAYNAFHGCAACSIPGYFLGGDSDFRTAQMNDTANAYASCGAEVTTSLVANGDHQATIEALTSLGEANTILSWMLDRPLACD